MMLPLISRVRLRNFKSIASCDIRLENLSVLVGLNGSGKSNFLDAFAFISDACNTTLDSALRNRGGLSAVRRKSHGHPNNFGMTFFLNLPNRRNGFFAFDVAALPGERFEIRREMASISDSDPGRRFEYIVERGRVINFTESTVLPDVRGDRLFLTSVAGIRPFDTLFDAMSKISVYNINPDEFRFPQPHDSGDVMKSSGQNMPSVIRRLSAESPDTFARIKEYLTKIVRGIEGVEPRSLGPTETIQFTQFVQGASSPWRFDALNMSNGTLRSLGVLVALFHRRAWTEQSVPFIGIEEPEGTIHPAAAAVLMDAIIEASGDGQVVLTTHSPELLDHDRISEDSILVVTSELNETKIDRADSTSRAAIKDRLLTAGDLLRANQLKSSLSATKYLSQADLFELS